MTETVLYLKDNRGDIREWGISVDFDCITIRHGTRGGAMQFQYENVEDGKGGRTLEEQIDSRVNSRINKQRDKGYNESLTFARIHETRNAAGRYKPMLAQKLQDVRGIDWDNAFCQPKFDGNRCLIYCEDGVNKAYTRNGKPIESIGHILDDIALHEGMTVDGELYCHGQSLQTIVSWVKRKQESTLRLKYHLYDYVAPDLPFKERSLQLATLPMGNSISFVRGEPIASREALQRAFREYRNEGYEGAMLRWGDFGYEHGKRSKSLAKLKEFHDAEFEVVNITRSADGWGILECTTENGLYFRVSAPGDMAFKRKVYNESPLYIGKHVTVEYANLTADGIPFHPIAINFREEVQG